jgi:aerobic-type carbon monoxide dehydrogenase small subunit (CoxS/CutS family)
MSFYLWNLHLFKVAILENPKTDTIPFTLVHDGNEYAVQTYRNEYFSLMSLISAYLAIPGFGLCSGMGSCGTCAVTVNGRSSLSCSLPVDYELANKIIMIEKAFY